MRILAWLMVLTTLAWAGDLTAATQIFSRAAKDAFEWGNYRASARLLAELRKAYEPRAAASSVARAELASIDADRVLLLGRARYYTDALALGEAVLASPDAEPLARNRAALGMILVARDAQRPELLDQLLGQESSNPVYRFALRTFAFERRLQREPTLDLPAVQQALEEAWKPLAGYVPTRLEGALQPDGLLFTEAERFWWRLLTDRGDTAASPADRKVYQKLFLAELDRTQKLVLPADAADRRDYTCGFLDLFLDFAEFYHRQGDDEAAERALTKGGQAEIIAFMLEEGRKAEPAFRKQLAADAKKCQGTPLSAQALPYSRLEGSLYRLQARALELRARLPQTRNRAPLLAEAYALQRKAAGGSFLGMDDVRWEMLASGTGDTTALSAQLLKESERQAYRPGIIVALSYQARELARRGQRREAIAQVTRAVALVEEYLTLSGAAEERELYQPVYDLLAELQLEAGQAEAAFDTLGRKAQAQATGPELGQLETLRGQAQALEEEIASKRAMGADSAATEQLLASTRGEFTTVVARLRRENPRYEERLAIRPVNFARQQALLPADVALVQYFPSGSQLYIFVVTRQSLKIRQVPLTDAALADELRAFRRSVLQQQPVSSRLYELLIKPIEADVAALPVLAVVPTGALCYLPFAALSRAPGDYLIQRKQVVTLLKSSDLSALGQSPSPRRDGILVLANPDGSLPAATQEATEVANLFGTQPLLGAAATAERLRGAQPVAYVHLATHGTLNARNPSASQLLLAEGALTVTDIYQLQLAGVRLATLSACQTALAEANPGADLNTLADAFSLAGANAVVASLWSVADESTRDLMVEFYRRIKAGENLAQSLQGAQLKLLAAGRSPFHWAPFVLIGDWR